MMGDGVITAVNVLAARDNAGLKCQGMIDESVCEQLIGGMDTGAHELNRPQKISLACLLGALAKSGIPLQTLSSACTGFYMGGTYAVEGFKSNFFKIYRQSDPVLTSPSLFPFTTANSLSAWLAIVTGATGPNTTFVSGCTASAHALMAASDAVGAGECAMAIVMALDLVCVDLREEFGVSGFVQESAGCVIIEDMSAALAAGRKPLGKVKNFRFERNKILQGAGMFSALSPPNVSIGGPGLAVPGCPIKVPTFVSLSRDPDQSVGTLGHDKFLIQLNSDTQGRIECHGGQLGTKVLQSAEFGKKLFFDMLGIQLVHEALMGHEHQTELCCVDPGGNMVRFSVER